MNSILIYTFRTFPYIEQINAITKNVFIFGELKKDILELEKIIKNGNFDYIIGIAKTHKKSVFETKGINKFNKGKILKEGKEIYSLFYPETGYQTIGINNLCSTTFCNWCIYHVGKIIENNGSEARHSFVHIQEKDIPVLRQYLELE